MICLLEKKHQVLLLHEVMHLRVDFVNDGHQIIKNMFCVIHCRVHEVPANETLFFIQDDKEKN